MTGIGDAVGAGVNGEADGVILVDTGVCGGAFETGVGGAFDTGVGGAIDIGVETSCITSSTTSAALMGVSVWAAGVDDRFADTTMGV